MCRNFSSSLFINIKLTLGKHVKLVVDVLVDLLGITVLLQHSSKNSKSSHPNDLEWESGVGSTTSLSVSGVSSLGLGFLSKLNTGSGMNSGWLLHDKTILDDLSDVGTGVSKGDLVGLVWVNPDLSGSTLEDGRRESLLELKGNLAEGKRKNGVSYLQWERFI